MLLEQGLENREDGRHARETIVSHKDRRECKSAHKEKTMLMLAQHLERTLALRITSVFV